MLREAEAVLPVEVLESQLVAVDGELVLVVDGQGCSPLVVEHYVAEFEELLRGLVHGVDRLDCSEPAQELLEGCVRSA